MPTAQPPCPHCLTGRLFSEPDPDAGAGARSFYCVNCGWRREPPPLPLIQQRRNPRHEGAGLG